ncbi:sulfate adenylyltransferase [Actinomadura pelletieri DSM 43383]|uniref:Adenylyl-sulfate kinase n=1 Tax=Actinomadura pelletieri DSM 43383 TaxID=1120940 RepID=A0A495QIS9_9ACTN|nr:adenylyl-sulfate kinase [Actinomadura pelletieri]RKS72062.1 sulfate adenylyltransferase [Actinomadura pelletieri DSM 43383]
MTAEAGLPDTLRDLPAWTPGPVELADLELILAGVYRPLTGFLGSFDTAMVIAGGRLADGTPWPVPVTLSVPKELTGHERLVLQDPEGVPLAVLRVTEAWQDPTSHGWRLAGPLEALRAPAHGPFHGLRRRPDELEPSEGPTLAAPPEGGRPPTPPVNKLTTPPEGGRPPTPPVNKLTTPPEGGRPPTPPVNKLAVATREPLHRKQLGQIRQVSERLGATVLVLPLLGGEHDESLVRALLGVRRELPDGAQVVPVPLPVRGAEPTDPKRDVQLQAHVAAAYGATHLLADREVEGTAVPTVVPEPWAYDADVEVWRPVARIEPDHVQAELTRERLDELLDAGEPIPDWFTPPAVARELALARPPKLSRGITVFFTGLSGSGKSTVARGLADALIERGGRTVTLLDGDVVRRMLSSGLTFSRADRDLNIRRIGFVAAEITRHGGTAICAPIAPYAATRAEVRRMVSAVGDFILVHVSTPLEECERRDRKGLYAKARAGVIPEFTGISDPYEEPEDADLTLDTSRMSPQQAVDKVLDLLVDGGWVRPA